MSRNSLRRFIRATSSVVYLGVLLSAPGLDAVLEAATTEQTVHVEAQSENICTQGHDEYLCQLCRLLNLPASPSGRPQFAWTASSRYHASDVSVNAVGRPRRAHRPRAPPIS